MTRRMALSTLRYAVLSEARARPLWRTSKRCRLFRKSFRASPVRDLAVRALAGQLPDPAPAIDFVASQGSLRAGPACRSSQRVPLQVDDRAAQLDRVRELFRGMIEVDAAPERLYQREPERGDEALDAFARSRAQPIFRDEEHACQRPGEAVSARGEQATAHDRRRDDDPRRVRSMIEVERTAVGRGVTWSRWFGQLEGLVKVYSDCEITPSSSSAPALTGGCHGWHEAGSYPVIDDDDDALWNCGNLAAGVQAWAAALAREISNGLWAPASPPSGFSATVSGRPQAGQVHSAGWDMVLGPLMR